MSTRRKSYLWLAAGIVSMAVWTTSARVYLRTGTGRAGGASAEYLGWTTAYQAAMTINGGAADVDVLQCDRGPTAALEHVGALYERGGGEVAIVPGDRMAWAMVTVEDRVIRLLALALDNPRSCLVVRTEQPRDTYQDARRTGVLWTWVDVPPYPGSIPSQVVSDERTRSELAVSRAPVHPDDVLQFYDDTLQASGWQPAFASLSGPGGSAPTFYMKGSEICCVSAKSAGVSQGSVITLLRKRLETKAGL